MVVLLMMATNRIWLNYHQSYNLLAAEVLGAIAHALYGNNLKIPSE